MEVEYWHRAYYDGSLRQGKSGIGVVIKDHNKKVLFTYYEKIELEDDLKNNSTYVEYAAMRCCLQKALDLGYKKIKLKGDSSSVRRVVNNKIPHRNKFNLIVDEINFLLTQFNRVKISNIPRRLNSDAHRLASIATA